MLAQRLERGRAVDEPQPAVSAAAAQLPAVSVVTTASASARPPADCAVLFSTRPLVDGAVAVPSTDLRRAAFVLAYGGLFVGPLGHWWYELLDRATRRAGLPPGGGRGVAAKIALDTAVFGPVHVFSFFGLMGVVEGESLERVEARMRTSFWPTLVAESVAWPVVQAVNFSRVPVQHQLLFVNVVSLADCIWLSYAKHNLAQSDWCRGWAASWGPFGP